MQETFECRQEGGTSSSQGGETCASTKKTRESDVEKRLIFLGAGGVRTGSTVEGRSLTTGVWGQEPFREKDHSLRMKKILLSLGKLPVRKGIRDKRGGTTS